MMSLDVPSDLIWLATEVTIGTNEFGLPRNGHQPLPRFPLPKAANQSRSSPKGDKTRSWQQGRSSSPHFCFVPEATFEFPFFSQIKSSAFTSGLKILLRRSFPPSTLLRRSIEQKSSQMEEREERFVQKVDPEYGGTDENGSD